jgi:hypothetical protein
VLKRIADGAYVTPEVANPVVDAKMGRIVRKALAHDPDDRYQTIEALRHDLLAFLADVDISRPRKELGAYFADTTVYSRVLQERVVTALATRGKAALERGDKARALAFFDRVLCTDPRNAEVLELLEHLSRQRRIGRVVAVVLLAAALGGGAWAVASFWPQTPAKATSADAAAESATLAGSPDSRAARADLGPDRGVARDLQLRADKARRAIKTVKPVYRKVLRIKPLPQRERMVEILPHPKAVTIFLGNKRLGDYGPDLRRVKVPAGDQVLTFRNAACCFDRVVRIRAGVTPKQLRIRLAWKPARLKVRIEPTTVKAAIAVGKAVVGAGRSVSVPIPKSSFDGRINVDVKVTAPGYAAVSRKIPVRANGSKQVTVILQRAK